MRVFKFGGASVKNADAVRNVAHIISLYTDRPLVVVVSAMAKTTSSLENVVQSWLSQNENAIPLFKDIIEFHHQIALELFPNNNPELDQSIQDIFDYGKTLITSSVPENYSQAYDALVHVGEILSTKIIHYYLLELGHKSEWLDTKKIVTTNNAHRRATVDWEETSAQIKAAINEPNIYLVQGFIGSTKCGVPTTLGREGSDYTASVFANILQAEEVTIWKDVPGVLTGDPKVFSSPILLEEISYREAIELAYYGASVIHPKTIQPLQEKNIPLFVRSFMNPELPGTVIGRGLTLKPFAPCYILKKNQALLSVATRDLAFIVEEHLQLIYKLFHEHGLTVNTMQNSAISTSFCVNNDPNILPKVVAELNPYFSVKLNEEVELYTIRHHNPQTREAIRAGKNPLLEQITRETYQVVLHS